MLICAKPKIQKYSYAEGNKGLQPLILPDGGKLRHALLNFRKVLIVR
jgi:hypothetical protein